MVEIFKTGALLFFFVFFCGVVIWTFWSRRSRGFSHDASLPLDEGARVYPDGNETR
jgi:cbb3-type cytochrome oxidase subunit 3